MLLKDIVGCKVFIVEDFKLVCCIFVDDKIEMIILLISDVFIYYLDGGVCVIVCLLGIEFKFKCYYEVVMLFVVGEDFVSV